MAAPIEDPLWRYKIVRYYFEKQGVVIKTGLTLFEAQQYCKSPESSSSTAQSPELINHTRENGWWTDGWMPEDGSRWEHSRLSSRTGRKKATA